MADPTGAAARRCHRRSSLTSTKGRTSARLTSRQAAAVRAIAFCGSVAFMIPRQTSVCVGRLDNPVVSTTGIRLSHLVEIARRRPRAVLAWVLGLHLVVWTALPILLCPN